MNRFKSNQPLEFRVFSKLTPTDGENPLTIAYKREKFELIIFLVVNGKTAVEDFNQMRQTPLLIACETNRMEITNFLALHTLDPDMGKAINLQSLLVSLIINDDFDDM
eukprot:Awhi_evm2s14435